MMRAGRVRAVVAFEFMSTVRRKSYLIVTFGLPFFFLLYGAMAGFLGSMAEDRVCGCQCNDLWWVRDILVPNYLEFVQETAGLYKTFLQ